MNLVRLWLFMVICIAGPAVAGPFEDAVAAYKKGEYETALRLWRPLAERGSSSAQFNLGLMFSYGRGVPQDYATAVAWYQKAAAQGNAAGQSNLVVHVRPWPRCSARLYDGCDLVQ